MYENNFKFVRVIVNINVNIHFILYNNNESVVLSTIRLKVYLKLFPARTDTLISPGNDDKTSLH